MKKNKWIIALITLALLAIIILVPVIIDKAIFGNSISSNISNSDWAGFFGGYIGAIVGGLFSLMGIVATIIFTNNQNRKDRELQIKPYFDIRYKHTDKFICNSKPIGTLAYRCDSMEDKGPLVFGLLLLKNVGAAAAINCEIINEPIDDGREHYPVLFAENGLIGETCLSPGEEGSIPIWINFNFDKITENALIELGNGEVHVNPIVMSKYKPFNIVLHFKYMDILENHYDQKIILYGQVNTRTSKDNPKWEFGCDLYLREIESPKKI